MNSTPRLLLILLALAQTCSLYADFDQATEIYRQGNYAAAFSEFLPLANAGDPRAQTILAMMYKYGESVDQDWSEALMWYRKAAELGYVPAQYSIGEIYADGLGVNPDRDAAIHWLTLAARGGLAKANSKLASLQADQVPAPARELASWSKAWNLHPPGNISYDVSPSADPDQTPAGVTFRVQLGAMKTLETAHRMWNQVRDAHPALLANKEPIFRRKRRDPDTLYIVQTGPFPTLASARSFCDTLADRGMESGCLAMQSAGDAEP